MPLLRRDLIALIGAAVTLWPLAGAAQPEKVPTIGVLVVGSPASERFGGSFSKTCASSATSKEATFDTNSDRTWGSQAGFPLWLRSWCGFEWT